MTKASKLREMINRDGPTMMPGCYDAISAKLIEKAGFEVTCTSGYCLHASMMAKPDIGLVSYTEMTDVAGRIAAAIDIPLMVDGESGYGNAINVMREISDLENRGAAGIFFDDQDFPPNCPWVKAMHVVSPEEVVGKIEAALTARRDPDFVICVRSDAPDFDEQVRRVNMYLDAGADIVMISGMTPENVKRAPKLVHGPMMCVVSAGRGGPRAYTAEQLGDLGFKLLMYPQAPLFMNIKNTYEGLKLLLESGTQDALGDHVITMDEYFDIIDMEKHRALEARYLKG